MMSLCEAREQTPDEIRALIRNGEIRAKLIDDWTLECWACQGNGYHFEDCPHCGGCGSREAHLDEVWREALENEAANHGAWIENGDGDACDLFLGREA